MTEPNNQLAVSQQQLAIASPAAMMAEIIKGGITEANVTVMERLMAMQERMEAAAAVQERNVAFKSLQEETSPIQASAVVPDKNGGVKFRFAPYEEVMAMVRPLLAKHGFSVRFSSERLEKSVKVTCFLHHISGAPAIENHFEARIGNGPPGANESQADAAAKTLAKRNALCDALNIVVERETGNDARAMGSDITPDQAADIQRRVETITPKDSWHRSLLQYAGVDISGIPDEPVELGPYYAKIQTGRLKEVLAYLSETEAKKGVKR